MIIELKGKSPNSRQGFYERTKINGKYHYSKIKKNIPQQTKKHDKTPQDEEITAYEIETQSSIDTHKAGRYKTKFEYNAKGIFANKPTAEKLEQMTKNSIMGAFNSGAVKGKYLKNSLFKKMLDDGTRGFTIKEIKIKKQFISNQIDLKLFINKNGKKWSGEN